MLSPFQTGAGSCCQCRAGSCRGDGVAASRLHWRRGRVRGAAADRLRGCTGALARLQWAPVPAELGGLATPRVPVTLGAPALPILCQWGQAGGPLPWWGWVGGWWVCGQRVRGVSRQLLTSPFCFAESPGHSQG